MDVVWLGQGQDLGGGEGMKSMGMDVGLVRARKDLGGGGKV